MSETDLQVIILAAGQGTRMKSGTPKVLHRVAGRALVAWPLELARGLRAAKIFVVLGHQIDLVRAALDARFADAYQIVHQAEQRGTGHAVAQALPALHGAPAESRVLILCGDVPLTPRAVLDALLAAQGDAPLALVTTKPRDPTGYGRVVRSRADGKLSRIVEHRDASPEEREIGEVNAGIYVVNLGFLRTAVAQLTPTNAQGELYLTDVVAHAAAAGDVPTVSAEPDDVAGVNDRVELARLDGVARRRIAEAHMRAGVTISAPETVTIEADVILARDVEIAAGVALRGRTRVGEGTRIDCGCVVTDSEIGAHAFLKPYSVLTGSQVGARAQLGPFAHCRPGTILDEDVHVGNFVETKKAHLGAGAKANHLAYLGDAEIGARVNVGAGTITCNYDGEHKHMTVIDEGVFIGSDTQLVAPVHVGKGAYIGAGTTVTKDVPAGALAVSRAPQKNIEGYAERKKTKRGARPGE